MSDKRKRAARAIMAETGWSYAKALHEADRRHAAEAQAGGGENAHLAAVAEAAPPDKPAP